MKAFSSVLLPHLADRGDETEARKSALDLLRIINTVALNTKFGDELAGNYTQFEDTGTLVSVGAAVTWNDLIIPGLATRVGGTAPTFAAITGGIYGLRFNAGATESVHASFEIMHDYKEGTNLDFHVHWCPTTTNTGNITWGLEYTICNIGTPFPAATTVTATVAAPGVVNRHVLTDVVSIPGYGLRIGTVIIFRLYRSGATDTFTGNAFLLSVGVHYQCDTLGSRKETSK